MIRFEKEPTFSKLPHFEWVNSVLGKVLTELLSGCQQNVMLEITVFTSILYFFHKLLEVHFLNMTFIILLDLANINGVKSLLPST